MALVAGLIDNDEKSMLLKSIPNFKTNAKDIS